MAQLLSLTTCSQKEITYGTGAPSVDPGTGPIVYVNTDNGDLYTWNNTIWVLNTQTPGVLPVYDGIEDAISNGLTSGQKFKLSTTNVTGQLPGTIIEL